MISTAACAVGAASAEIPRLESANPASPNFQFVMVSFRLPLLKGRQNPVGASLDERAVIVRDRVHLQHVPGQQRDHSEFERLRPSALSASGAFNQDGGATHSV